MSDLTLMVAVIIVHLMIYGLLVMGTFNGLMATLSVSIFWVLLYKSDKSLEY